MNRRGQAGAPRKCVVCGEGFAARNARQTTCGSAECIAERKRRAAKAWYEQHQEYHASRCREQRQRLLALLKIRWLIRQHQFKQDEIWEGL